MNKYTSTRVHPTVGLAMVGALSLLWIFASPGRADGTAPPGQSEHASPTWTLVTGAPAWPGRSGHGLVVFQDHLWLMAGATSAAIQVTNDIYRTSDGHDWELVTASAPWPPRINQGTLVHDGRMWVIGGWGGSGVLGDIWHSADGVNWTETTPSGFTARNRMAVESHSDAMWIFGGNSRPARSADVLRSLSGQHWTQVNPIAAWGARSSHESAVHRGQLWISGGVTSSGLGFASGNKNDVWRSENGVDWDLATADAGFVPRFNHRMVSWKDQLWILGGTTGVNPLVLFNDVWRSENGEDWVRVEEESPWSARSDAGVVVWKDKLWLVGGWLGRPDGVNAYANDVWYAAFPQDDVEGELLLCHSADLDCDGKIRLSELLRIVQIFISGGYQCVGAAPSEDGYLPGAGSDHDCRPHDLDYLRQDWRIDFRELLRGIQIFSWGSYRNCADSEDGFCR